MWDCNRVGSRRDSFFKDWNSFDREVESKENGDNNEEEEEKESENWCKWEVIINVNLYGDLNRATIYNSIVFDW